MSVGQKQRVASARAIVTNPSLILADEPTGALDSINGEKVIALFRKLVVKSQQTLVIVTHDAGVAAAADRVVKMRDGRIVGDSVATTVQAKTPTTK